MYRDTAMTYAQQLHEVKLLSLDRRLTSLMSKIKQGAPPPPKEKKTYVSSVYTLQYSKYSLPLISFYSGLVLSLSMGTRRR